MVDVWIELVSARPSLSKLAHTKLDSCCRCAHHRQLFQCKLTRQHPKPAVWCHDKSFAVDMAERREQPPDDLFDRLDSASRHRHAAEDHRLRGKAFEKPEIVAAMRVLDRDLVESQPVHLAGKPVIG